MQLDLTKKVFFKRGVMDIKPVIEELVDAGLDAARRNRLFRLSNKVHESNGSVDLDDGDVELLMMCVEQNALDPWVYGSMHYLIQPEKMAESDRAIFEKRYAAGG